MATGKTYEDVWAKSDDAYKARFGGDTAEGKAKAMQAMKDWNIDKYGTTEPTAEAASRGITTLKLGEQHGEAKTLGETKKTSAELEGEVETYKKGAASGEITTLGNLGTKPNINLSLSGATNTRQNANSANIFSKLSNNKSVVGNFGNGSKMGVFGTTSLGVDTSKEGLKADVTKNIKASTNTDSKTKDFSDGVYDTTSSGIKNRFGGGISKFLQKRKERKNSTAGPDRNVNSVRNLDNQVQDRTKSSNTGYGDAGSIEALDREHLGVAPVSSTSTSKPSTTNTKTTIYPYENYKKSNY